jgi:hypothetical protein
MDNESDLNVGEANHDLVGDKGTYNRARYLSTPEAR